MRRRQHPWAASFGKQKQPETLCVCKHPLCRFIRLFPSSQAAFSPTASSLVFQPPTPSNPSARAGSRRAGGCDSRALERRSRAHCCSPASTPSPPGDRPSRSSPRAAPASLFHSNMPFASELQFQDLTKALLPSRNRK